MKLKFYSCGLVTSGSTVCSTLSGMSAHLSNRQNVQRLVKGGREFQEFGQNLQKR